MGAKVLTVVFSAAVACALTACLLGDESEATIIGGPHCALDGGGGGGGDASCAADAAGE